MWSVDVGDSLHSDLCKSQLLKHVWNEVITQNVWVPRRVLEGASSGIRNTVSSTRNTAHV